MRALFDYDPQEDELVPCVQAGVPFKAGDILQVGAGIHDLCAAAAVATLFLFVLLYSFMCSLSVQYMVGSSVSFSSCDF